MKRNDLNDLKKSDKKALLSKVSSLHAEIKDLVIEVNMGNVKNYKSLKSKRKDLAQTLTVVRQIEIIERLEEQNAKSK